MYQVITYAVKMGFFGPKESKFDSEMTAFLNMYEQNGWILVSMTGMYIDGFYKMVFRKA